MPEPLLEVENLKTYFFLERGTVRAVDGVSFSIDKGETLGLVGESGCGKSMTALSIMRLLPPDSKIVNGKITFEGKNIVKASEEELRRVRGEKIAMIFQDPTAALNPLFTVGDQITEALAVHRGLHKSEAVKKAVELLEIVGVPSAAERVSDHPHQFSGGMRQRVMIAMALSCNPSLLIADEPTTNLDVTIQAQILELMKSLKKDFQSSIVLITHDLGIVAEMCNRVAVMYAGEVVEYTDVDSLFFDPKHPYTTGLLSCIPRNQTGRKLKFIGGTVPDLGNPPSGCRFHPRCPYAFEKCSQEAPKLTEISQGHYVSCHLYNGK